MQNILAPHTFSTRSADVQVNPFDSSNSFILVPVKNSEGAPVPGQGSARQTLLP